MGRDMKYGICEWVLPAKMQGPAVCKLAKDMGLDGVALELGHAKDMFPLANDYIIQAYMEERERWQIAFPALACNMTDFFPMTAPRGTAGRDMVEYALRLSIDTAKKMQIPVVQIPNFLASAIQTEADLKQAAQCLQYASDMAADAGIIIGTENCLSIEWQLKEIELVDRDNFKVYFDTQNYQLQAGIYTPDIVESLYQHIVQVHLKDGIAGGGNRKIGDGENDVCQSIENFLKCHYKGWMIFENEYFKEPLARMGKDSFSLLKEDLEYTKSIIG